MQQKQKKTVRQFLRSMQGQRLLTGIVFTIGPLLLLIVFTYLPLGKMVQFSFYDMKYLGPRTFVGWKNYLTIFQREDIRNALKLSLVYLGGAVVQMALALLLATILTSGMKHTAFLKGCLFFPYLVSGIAVGFIFKFFFSHGFVLDTLLGALGIPLDSLPNWLSDVSVNNYVLAGTSVWRGTGQSMVLYIGAMMSVDNDLYEAAALDGANAWHRFWSITFPGIKTVVVLTVIMSISGALSAFESSYVITGGAFGTATYFVLMNRIAHVNQKVGLASAMAVVLLLLICLVTVTWKIISGYFMDEDANGMTRAEYRREEKNRKAERKGAK